jgi:amino acid adenylation domain-containing protein
MTGLATRLERLTPEKRAAYERLLRERRRPAGATTAIPRRGGAGPFPLGFVQERLWFLEQLEPGHPLYNVPLALGLRGRLDPSALEASLREVVRRHASLRAAFSAEGGTPVQRVCEAVDLRLERRDMAGLAEDEVRRCAEVEVRRAFDLSRAPLLRALLLRRDEDEHVLVLTFHHLVGDGWSVGVLVRELGDLYPAFVAGRPSPLPELGIQFCDFALWERQHFSGRALQEKLRFWTRALAGAPQALELPTDRPRPAVRSGAGGRCALILAPRLVDALQALAQAESATLFMVLLAAFQTLLYRYSGQEDLLVGTPVAARVRQELEPLIGCFANTMVLRGDLASRPTFRQLLRRVRRATLAAYEHQDLPFEQLVQALQPARDLGRNPLFQAFFALHNMPMPRLDVAGLRLAPFEVETQTAKFDLSLALAPAPAGLTASLEYSTDLFDEGTAASQLAAYRTLLEAIVADADGRIDELRILGPAERRRILAGWNDTRTAWPPHGGLHRLIEQQVARSPQAVAVSAAEGTLTYAELNRRSNRLARELQRRGVGAESRVGVCMERGLELPVALLAILKAGGAYVPLDPGYPLDRLAFMLEDSGARVLLTQASLRDRLPGFAGDVLELDPSSAALELGEATDLPGETGDAQLAYVIYTSGSTGRPKGAMNTHGGICNRLAWMQDAYRLTAADRVLQKTPMSFDVSVWEFFWPLLAGARLVMARPGGHQDPSYLVRTIVAEGITTVHFVPSMLQMFLEEPSVASCASLRRVICSGEALAHDLQERCFDRLGADLHNLYGPTEASVDVTYWECRRDAEKRSVPIGRPIANTQIYVLDRHLQPLPVGAAGELYIGGVGLARGYHARRPLTAARFVPDPHGSEPGGRLYRTGDRARLLADGSIEYLGRADQQVKVRGVRIELEEIEACLRRHPGLRDAAAAVRRDLGGDDALVAYVVPASPGAELPPDLRGFLGERLPGAMVPAHYVALPALPLSPSGKLDRRALPAPPPSTAPGTTAAPRTDLERRVAEVFAGVLGLPAVGRDEDFFALGGDSFKAIRAVRDIGQGATVVDLFRAPSVGRLARRLASARSTDGLLLQELRAPASEAAPTLVCVPYGGGSPIAYGALARALPAPWGLCAVALPGHDPSRAQERCESVEAVARRCADEIEARVEGPVTLYGHCVGTAVAVETALLLEERGHSVAAVYVGAALPPRRSLRRFEIPWVRLRNRLTSDAALGRRLSRLGFAGALEGEALDFILACFRRDVDAALRWFGAAFARPRPRRLAAPLRCVVGGADPFTPRSARRHADWGFWARSVELVTLPDAGHYFVKDRAQELARLIAEEVPPGDARERRRT